MNGIMSELSLGVANAKPITFTDFFSNEILLSLCGWMIVHALLFHWVTISVDAYQRTGQWQWMPFYKGKTVERDANGDSNHLGDDLEEGVIPVKLQSLRKEFHDSNGDKVVAVDDLSFEIAKGNDCHAALYREDGRLIACVCVCV